MNLDPTLLAALRARALAARDALARDLEAFDAWLAALAALG
jgi:hypothetical protein